MISTAWIGAMPTAFSTPMRMVQPPALAESAASAMQRYSTP